MTDAYYTDELTVLHRVIRALDDAMAKVKTTNATKHKMMDLRANLMLRLDVITQERVSGSR